MLVSSGHRRAHSKLRQMALNLQELSCIEQNIAFLTKLVHISKLLFFSRFQTFFGFVCLFVF